MGGVQGGDADLIEVSIGAAGVFGRDRMGGEQARDHPDRALPAERAGGAQHLQLVRDGEAVARLHLKRGHPLGQHPVEPCQRTLLQLGLARRTRGADGRDDPAAGARHIFVARTL